MTTRKTKKTKREKKTEPMVAWAVQPIRDPDDRLWTHTVRFNRDRSIEAVIGGRPAFDRLRASGLVKHIRVKIVPLSSPRTKKAR